MTRSYKLRFVQSPAKYFMFELLFLIITVPNLLTTPAQAAEEDTFLGKMQPPSGQAMGRGQSALWTMPLVATQYQPLRPTPAMQAAMLAQQEGRFLDALIQLDEAEKKGQASASTRSEMDLLRASFLLQGNQPNQAIGVLAPLLASDQYSADAYALTAMAYLEQGKTQEAFDSAQRAQNPVAGVLPKLALSYALQGMGRLTDAFEVMHGFNAGAPPSAIALAREAELALTLDHIQRAEELIKRSQATDSTQPYVISVSGLVFLIEGDIKDAKSAFETALKRDPKDTKALLGLGLAEIKLGNLQAGQGGLQAANDADPYNALVLTYLGRLQQQLGQTEAAKASWMKAEQADPKDPMPWLYQARMELQNNQPLDARKSLLQAQARTKYRAVYRGERLLKEDAQLMQINLAEAERQLGLNSVAFHELTDSSSEKDSANLRGQAEILQGQRFGESARRSLLLQSQFGEKLGNLPVELDIYGDGAGQTGAYTPQHGVVSGLNSQQTSYNNYDDLFSHRATLAADAIKGSQNSTGEQIRLGAGNDTLGVGVAQRQYQTNGNRPYLNLDNHVAHATAQWRPTRSTQVFASYQTFSSRHGETSYPADPFNLGEYHQIEDHSSITRFGLRHSLDDNSELRGLISRQQTNQLDNGEFVANTLPYSNMGCSFCGPTLPFSQLTNYLSSETRSLELQYRRSGASYAAQCGISAARSPLTGTAFNYAILTNVAQQIYMDWQQVLNPHWQLEGGLAWGENDRLYDPNSTFLRRWLPKLGVIYTPDSTTHVRLAAWKNLDDAAVGNASLAPATLAGIVLNRPGDTYKLVRGIVLDADEQLAAEWLLEGRSQRRWSDTPSNFGASQVMTTIRIDETRLALHWQPSGYRSVNVTLEYDDEHVWNDPAVPQLNSALEQHLRSQQLGLRWLFHAQWTATLAWSHNLLAAAQQSSDLNANPILLDVRDRFNQADASLSWQFNRTGSVDMGVRNATNKSIQYTEIDPLVPRFSNGRLSYARLRLAW